MQQISASQFKARCLGLMDAVARSTPLGLQPSTELLGDVIAPLEEPWNALQ